LPFSWLAAFTLRFAGYHYTGDMRVRLLLLALLSVLLIAAVACRDDTDQGSDLPPLPTLTPTLEAPGADRPSDGLLGAYTGVPHTIADPAFEALGGAEAHYGTLGDAAYRIEIPVDWNGDLILYAHGFRGFGTQLSVDNLPRSLRQAILDRGYAWAASSFSENGYSPGIGADDTLALRDHFASEFGEPRRAYLVGVSMGGNVAALSLEHFDGAYDGALSLCGALGGQTQIDYLVSWARLAEYFSGVDLPVGPGADPGRLVQVLLSDVAAALGTPEQPTAAGHRFLSAVRELTGGPRPFFVEGVEEQYAANFALLLADPALETVLARAATNEGVIYSIDATLSVSAQELNEGIVRQLADPQARDPERYPDKVPTSGRLTAPMLALHTTGDLFVPISQAIEYAERSAREGRGDLFVARVIRAPGHCSFSDEEVLQAFDDLVRWVEQGERPAGDDLSGDLSDTGHDFTNPIRPGDPGTP
jgi:hypothetical protein